jgi:hypothetical protein
LADSRLEFFVDKLPSSWDAVLRYAKTNSNQYAKKDLFEVKCFYETATFQKGYFSKPDTKFFPIQDGSFLFLGTRLFCRTRSRCLLLNTV